MKPSVLLTLLYLDESHALKVRLLLRRSVMGLHLSPDRFPSVLFDHWCDSGKGGELWVNSVLFEPDSVLFPEASLCPCSDLPRRIDLPSKGQPCVGQVDASL